MREGAHRRLAGAVVIVTLVVIFVPMLFEDEPMIRPQPMQPDLPPEPVLDGRFESESFLPLPGPGAGVGGDAAPGVVGDAPWTPEVETPDASQLVAPPEPPEPAQPQPQPQVPAGPGLDTSRAKPSATTAPSFASPPPPRADGMPSWVVQVASVVTPQGASELQSRLRSAGFPAFVQTADVGGQRYYRVRVGPELERARAEQMAERLRAQEGLDTLIQQYP